jgi:hypothetical protein
MAGSSSALRMTAECGGNDGIIVGASSLCQSSRNLDDVGKGPLPTEMLDVLVIQTNKW